MKLANAVNMTLEESQVFMGSETLLEDGEGPRWKFRYDNFDVDPTPDILLLGAYRHPNTGNNLVGGINIHYLNDKQLEDLTFALPKIMKGSNLRDRYRIGKRIAPDVFGDYYRTYNSEYIRGIKQDVLYPKFGFAKTAKDWLKKKVQNIFRRKQEREKEAEPKYPEDLKNMQDRLNQVVTQLQQRQETEPDEVPDTPEMRRARQAYQKFQLDKAKRASGLLDADDETLEREIDNYIDKTSAEEQPEQPDVQDDVPKTERTPEERAEDIEQTRQDNLAELEDDDLDLEESIIYYSPVRRRYVVEKV